MTPRIVKALDADDLIGAALLTKEQWPPGAEDPRAKQLPDFHHVCLRDRVARWGRHFPARRQSVGKVGEVLPLLLRENLLCLVVPMPVRIHEPGKDRFAAEVDDAGVARHPKTACPT